MDGRDFGPPRSVHVPPPLLAMETHRLGPAATAARRIPPSPGHLGTGHPANLHGAKFLPSVLNLHPHHSDAFPAASSPFLPGYSGPSPLTSDPAYRSPNQMAQLWASHAAAHEGYAPLPGGLYPSPYHLPLGNLEPPPPSLGLAPHHHLYNTPHQERFFLPVSLPQPPLHHSSAPPSSTPQSSSREVGRDRDRLYREEKEREEPQERDRDRLYREEREREEPQERDRDRLYREEREREEPQEGGRDRLYREEKERAEPQERDRDRLYREEREREEPQERGRDRLYREEREREEPQEGGRDRLYREEREREEPQEGGQNRLYREEREREEPQERGRDRLYREERERDRGERERSREEPRPYSVVDLTQDGRSGERDRHRERERERERDRDREREREAFLLHHSAPRPPQGCSSSGRYPETDDTPTRSPNPNPSPSPHTHTDRLRKTELTYSGGLLPGPTYPANREPIREQRVSAPTYVPSVEVYDERIGPIQIASQARDKHDKLRERERERERESSRFPEKTLLDHRSSLPGDLSNQREREEGSVICSNGSALKRDGYVSQSGFSPDPRDTPKHAIRLGLERVGEEPKWNPISPLANYATSHMAALASQHGHAHSAQQARTHTQPSHNNQQELNRPPSNPHTPQHGHTHTQPSHHNQHELNRPPSNPNTPQHRHTHSPHPQPQRGEEGQRRFLDTSALYRPVGGRGGSRGGGSEGGAEGGEVSAMQSLIKYSGTFPPEGQGSSRQNTDNQAAFGGLAFMRLEGGGAGGRLTKREQERPDSTRSLGRGEGAGPGEGGGEVRHPPVGIAVAVARQRDSSSTDSQRPLVLHAGVKDEERGDERARHRGDRLGCLEREQEKLLRESKELAEFTQMHPPLVSSTLASNLMTSNLMVTGGSTRWPHDPSPLTSHPWMPRQGAPPIWLSGSPYGLGPSPLHQALPPYQLARDPQSGHLMVIATEHIPRYGGDVLDGGGAPLWPGVYGAGSSLQHAAQLQMLSQQQMLRQHELAMIQQHAAQVLELQRNAQLMERLKASEQRAALEEKTDKRCPEPKPRPSPRPTPSPSLHCHKTPLRSPPPSTSSLTPLPSPRPTLQHQEVQRERSHPSSPLPRPPAPHSASPLRPSSPVRPKQEADEGERGEKQTTAPFHRIYTDITPGYRYQSITAPFSAPFPPRPLPHPAGGNTHPSVSSLPPLPRATAPDVKPRGLELRPDQGTALKHDPDQEPPQLGMSNAALDPLLRTSSPPALSQIERDGESSLKHTHLTHTRTQLHTHPSLTHPHKHTNVHSAAQPCPPLPPTQPHKHTSLPTAPQPCPPLPHKHTGLPTAPQPCPPLPHKHTSLPTAPQPCTPLPHKHTSLPTAPRPCPPLPHKHTSLPTAPRPCTPLPHKHTSLPTAPRPCTPLPPTQPQEQQTEEEEEEEAEAVKMEVLTYSCRGSYQLPPSVPEVETKPEVTTKSSPAHYPSCTTASSERPTFRPSPDTHASPPPPLSPRPPPPSPLNIVPEDPMAGMIALLAASQMPQAAPPALPTLLQTEASSLGRDVASPGSLEVWALEGMTLLSNMASLEMDRIQMKQGQVLCGLDSLLEAGRKVLLEAIESQSHIDLPRQLHPSKTYSWRMRTDPQQLFSKVCVEVCDGGELQHRKRLAELQRRYRDKQRQLDKLQRRPDTHEVQPQEGEERRSLTRRGRGRPRKRKHVATSPGKLESRTGKLGRTVRYSELGDGGRKRFHCSREEEEEEEETEGGRGRGGGGEKRSWQDQEPSTSHSLEVFKARRVGLCDHEQLACDLDRALSLSVLGSSRRPPSDPSGKDGGRILSSGKGGKQKIRGQASSPPPLPHSSSQRSSYDYNSDSEEDVPRGGCPSLSGLRPHTAPPRKRPSPSSSNQAARERKQKHLSLLLQEAGLSSSDDSFDQESSTEDDDDDEGEESRFEGSELEESGLGLLARFAASALPANPAPLPRLHDDKHRSGQSRLGVGSGSDLHLRKFPSLLHGKRSAPELPLLPPAMRHGDQTSDETSPVKRKPRPSPRSPRRFTFDPPGGLGGGASEEEGWTRRRSERIFLHDASTNQISPSSKDPPISTKPGPRPKTTPREGKDLKKKRLKDSPLTPPSLSSPITESPVAPPLSPASKSQSKAKAKPREARGAVSRLMKSMEADEDFEPSQDSSFSEDDGPPPSHSSLAERTLTSAPVQCVLDKDSLQDGLRVLIPMDDQLLYAGHVNTVHSPDIYSVVVEGERGNRPHIYCLEQLLQEAIVDVMPPSVWYLPEGCRIAAYWSQQYHCLYPGTVVNGSSDGDDSDDLITVEFDDGDTGRIPLSHIRLLPPDYKIQCAEPSPALLVASCSRRRVRKCSKDTSETRSKAGDSAPKGRGRPAKKPKPKPEPPVSPEPREKMAPPGPSQAPDRPQLPSRPALDRPSSTQRPAQERPLSTPRPGPGRPSKPTSTPSLPAPPRSQNPRRPSSAQASPKTPHPLPPSLYHPAPYGKILRVDLYSQPNLASCNVSTQPNPNTNPKSKLSPPLLKPNPTTPTIRPNPLLPNPKPNLSSAPKSKPRPNPTAGLPRPRPTANFNPDHNKPRTAPKAISRAKQNHNKPRPTPDPSTRPRTIPGPSSSNSKPRTSPGPSSSTSKPRPSPGPSSSTSKPRPSPGPSSSTSKPRTSPGPSSSTSKPRPSPGPSSSTSKPRSSSDHSAARSRPDPSTFFPGISRPRHVPGEGGVGAQGGGRQGRKTLPEEPLVKLDHEGVTSPKTKKTKALMLLEGRGLRQEHTPLATAAAIQKPARVKGRAPESEAGLLGREPAYRTPSLGRERDRGGGGDREPKREEMQKQGEEKRGEEREKRGEEREKRGEKREKRGEEREKRGESHGSSSSGSEEEETGKKRGESHGSSSSGSEEEEETGKKTKCSSSCSHPSSPASSSSSSSSTSSSSSSSTDEESSCSSDEETAPAPPAPLPVSPPPSTPKEEVEVEVEEEKEEEEEKKKLKKAEEEEVLEEDRSPSSPPPSSSPSSKPARPRGRPARQKSQGGVGSVGRPRRREGVHLPTTKELAKRQRLPSVENRPKISAFLPARQLWKWFGKPTQRRGMKGKAKKLFYKAIVRGREMIGIGDCAVFLSAGRPNLPFIGKIQSMWESWGSNMVVRVNWFYHPEETNPGKKLHDKKNWDQMSGQSLPSSLLSSNQRKDFMERALYQSSHSDENDVQTVSHKCLVVSVSEYETMTLTRRYADSQDLYYLAGTYEPTTGMIYNTDGVPII